MIKVSVEVIFHHNPQLLDRSLMTEDDREKEEEKESRMNASCLRKKNTNNLRI